MYAISFFLTGDARKVTQAASLFSERGKRSSITNITSNGAGDDEDDECRGAGQAGRLGWQDDRAGMGMIFNR